MSEIDIQHLCTLAALRLKEDEAAAANEDLTHILRMVDQMRALDTQGVEPLAHPLDLAARLRADEVTERVDRETLQGSAPATLDGYYLVPRVVE